MSEENVELWRAVVEDAFFAPGTTEFDPEAAISRMAELWDPEVEFDVSAVPSLTSAACTGEQMPPDASGEGGWAPGKPSSLSTPWWMPGTR